jgi:hypothetical protein
MGRIHSSSRSRAHDEPRPQHRLIASTVPPERALQALPLGGLSFRDNQPTSRTCADDSAARQLSAERELAAALRFSARNPSQLSVTAAGKSSTLLAVR